MTAREAKAKMNPLVAELQALLTTSCSGLDVSNLADMGTLVHSSTLSTEVSCNRAALTEHSVRMLQRSEVYWSTVSRRAIDATLP